MVQTSWGTCLLHRGVYKVSSYPSTKFGDMVALPNVPKAMHDRIMFSFHHMSVIKTTLSYV